MPVPVSLAGVPRLVELAVALVDDDCVAVAVGTFATFDVGVVAEWVPDAVTFSPIGEVDRHLAVTSADNGDRMPYGTGCSPYARPKSGCKLLRGDMCRIHASLRRFCGSLEMSACQ